MVRLLLQVLFLLSNFSLFGEVLVSVAPHKYFVERIAGGTVPVILMVPPGVSAHSYEPTPRQVLAASKADIWFQVGDAFEPKAGEALKSANPKMQLIDLRKGVELIYNSGGCSCSGHDCCIDPHIWLSPKEAKAQARQIEQVLAQRYPENAQLYQKNLQQFLEELDQLDRDVRAETQKMPNRTIMVSHPAFAYLARDYGFEQLSLEWEGKEPTPQQLTKIINEARQKNIKVIYIQEQLNVKGSERVAALLGAKIILLDPYREDYPQSIRDIAKSFSEPGK